MTRQLGRWLVTGLCGLLAACAIITVNVYFPEKDVKQAYKSLDEMLLKQGSTTKEGDLPAVTPAPATTTEPADKPQSRLLPQGFSLVGTAHAAETIADDLAVELSSMPEVLKAYDEMKARLAELNGLRDSGAVGETNQGLVTIRDKAKGGGRDALIKAENDNRKTVITGMARAILKVNKQPVSNAGLKQVLPKAAATYADIRREAAKTGWWVQLANGRWVQK